MMRYMLVALVLAVMGGSTLGQFKPKADEQSRIGDALVRPDNGGLMFGWFDPNRLTMHHSYSLSYLSSGGQGLSLGALTSSLFYEFSDPLTLEMDVSMVHSPYSTLDDRFTRGLAGVHLSRAQLNYRPSPNTLFSIQYRQLPSMYFWNTPYRGNFFDGIDRYEEEYR